MKIGGSWRVFLGFLFLLASAGDAVTIRVVDEAGRPAAGVPVAPFWYLADGKWTPYGGTLTDVEGRIAIPEGMGIPMCLVALDMEGKRGSVFPMSPDKAGVIEARLAPIVPVPLALRWKESGKPVGSANVYVYRKSKNPPFIKAQFKEGAPPLPLPPGEYRLLVFSHQIETIEIDLSLPRDAKSLAEGIELVPSRLARLVGQELPAWTVAGARGVKADTAPADFRGRWLMVAVWGFW